MLDDIKKRIEKIELEKQLFVFNSYHGDPLFYSGTSIYTDNEVSTLQKDKNNIVITMLLSSDMYNRVNHAG